MESKQHGVYVARSWKVEKEILRLCLQQQLGTRISSKRLGDTVFLFSKQKEVNYFEIQNFFLPYTNV